MRARLPRNAIVAIFLPAFMIGACRAPAPAAPVEAGLAQWLECLPADAALTAAHRGTDRGSRLPENSLAALEALIERGIPIAEIDIARTRDGVHILYHDGVWEDGSNGRGVVAATDWATVQTFSLRDAQGRLTREGVPMLDAYLKAAKSRIFLEIDFKTTARYEEVIDIVTENDMMGDVVLIAYNAAQARKLRRFAPDVWISVPVEDAGTVNGNVLAWLGDSPRDTDLPAIARLSHDRADTFRNRDIIRAADIAVTDHALSERPVIGLADPDAFEACVAD